LQEKILPTNNTLNKAKLTERQEIFFISNKFYFE